MHLKFALHSLHISQLNDSLVSCCWHWLRLRLRLRSTKATLPVDGITGGASITALQLVAVVVVASRRPSTPIAG